MPSTGMWFAIDALTQRLKWPSRTRAAVVEIAEVGKYLALNEGDRLAGDVYPRLYCDADIRLSPTSITALVEALTPDEVMVAAPEVRSAVEESTWTVKVFFRAVENPLIAQWNYGLLAGRGLYGPSRAARRRFDVFPDLYADDLFFDSQSGPTEKIALSDATAVLRVPVNLRHLMKGEIRVADGNRQYRAAEHVDGGTTEHTAVHRDRFERSMRARITALWSAGESCVAATSYHSSSTLVFARRRT